MSIPDGSSVSPVDRLRDLLGEIVERFDIEAEVSVEEDDGCLVGRIDGEDVGLLIGRHGQTINAIQHLAQRIVFPGHSQSMRIVVDAGEYRDRRAEALRREADQAADEAVRSGESIELSPASAFERRLVHEYLRDRGDVRTESEGDEPRRYLVVSPID